VIAQIRPPLKTAVATNRTDTMAYVVEIHRLERFFDAIVCAADVPNPKPHPDLLLEAADRLHCRPDEALYIGDTQVDEQAAGAAKMHLAAYRNSALRAQYHLTSLGELGSILSSSPS
jgi:HAD superfamily hydrolase (TIGR01509 family)